MAPFVTPLGYLGRGWAPTPLCWADGRGRCACGRRHHKAAKAALLPSYHTLRPSEDDVRLWWRRWPQAGVGLLLEPSGLIVVDLDGPDAIAEAVSMGLAWSVAVETGAGMHLYYRAPPGTEPARRLHRGASGRIDVLGGGHVVAPPSVHRSGRAYRWLPGFSRPLPLAPDWALRILREPPANEPPPRAPGVRGPAPACPVSPGRGYRLPAATRQLLRGGWSGRYPSRSEGVWALAHALLRSGCTEQQAVTLLVRCDWATEGRHDPERWAQSEIARAIVKR